MFLYRDINHDKQCLAEQIKSQRALAKNLIESKPKIINKKMATITETQIKDKVYEEMKMLGLKQLLRNYPSKKPCKSKPSEALTTTSKIIAKDDKMYL